MLLMGLKASNVISYIPVLHFYTSKKKNVSVYFKPT